MIRSYKIPVIGGLKKKIFWSWKGHEKVWNFKVLNLWEPCVVFQSSVSIVVCKFIKFSLCFFPVYLIEDESVEVGVMNLTVECLAALKAVSEEMAAAADDSQ